MRDGHIGVARVFVHDMFQSVIQRGDRIMADYLATPHSYSSAVRAGDSIYLGLHRGGGDDFAAQLRDTLAGIERSLAHFGRPLSSLVQIHVYLKRIEDLGAMEKLIGDAFAEGRYPARMTTTTAFHDADCLVMIDGIATARDGDRD